MAFRDRQDVRDAVCGTSARKDPVADPRRAQGLEQAQASAEVVAVIHRRLCDGFSDVGIGRKVQGGHGPVPGKYACDGTRISGLDDRDRSPRQLAKTGALERIKADWLEARLCKNLAGVAADVTGCPGHEDRFHPWLSGGPDSISSKYWIVFARPSSSCTLGCQPSSRFARAMSGWRCRGSSGGSGIDSILEREPVRAMTFSASSRIVNSTGFP